MAFGCTPDVAVQLDWPLVSRVLEYRTAVAARDAFNDKDRGRGFERLQSDPAYLRILSMMHRAQVGLPLHGGDHEADGMEVALQHRTVVDDDSEDEEV